MAKLHNLHAFERDALSVGERVTVGNNRQVACTSPHDGTYQLSCRLHGSELVQKTWREDGTQWLRITDAGWCTVTTRNAIDDFLGALGYNAHASIAGGVLSVRFEGAELEPTKTRVPYDFSLRVA